MLSHHEVDGIDITLVFIRDLALWDNLQKQTDDVLWISLYDIIIILEKLYIVDKRNQFFYCVCHIRTKGVDLMGLQFWWYNGVLLGFCIVIEINFQLLVHNIILLMDANIRIICSLYADTSKKIVFIKNNWTCPHRENR